MAGIGAGDGGEAELRAEQVVPRGVFQFAVLLDGTKNPAHGTGETVVEPCASEPCLRLLLESPDRIRLAGLEILAAHHVAEGIPACPFYLLNQNIWASQIRTPEILNAEIEAATDKPELRWIR